MLIAPVIHGKKRFTLARPRRGAYIVQLAPGMTGDIQQAGHSIAVTREIDFDPGDKGKLTFEGTDGLRLELRFVDPPAHLPRPRLRNTECRSWFASPR